MKNPKTTLAGYLVLISAVATIGAHLLGGQGVGMVDLGLLSTALAGVGLISSADGGH